MDGVAERAPSRRDRARSPARESAGRFRIYRYAPAPRRGSAGRDFEAVRRPPSACRPRRGLRRARCAAIRHSVRPRAGSSGAPRRFFRSARSFYAAAAASVRSPARAAWRNGPRPAHFGSARDIQRSCRCPSRRREAPRRAFPASSAGSDRRRRSAAPRSASAARRAGRPRASGCAAAPAHMSRSSRALRGGRRSAYWRRSARIIRGRGLRRRCTAGAAAPPAGGRRTAFLRQTAPLPPR